MTPTLIGRAAEVVDSLIAFSPLKTSRTFVEVSLTMPYPLVMIGDG